MEGVFGNREEFLAEDRPFMRAAFRTTLPAVFGGRAPSSGGPGPVEERPFAARLAMVPWNKRFFRAGLAKVPWKSGPLGPR